jgi:hypothetical protein
MRAGVLLGAAAAAVLLAGCATAAEPKRMTTVDPPETGAAYTIRASAAAATACAARDGSQLGACVGWDESGALLVVAGGGSNCPNVAVSARADSQQTVVVEMTNLGGNSCTADSVPTTSSVAVPASIDRSRPVTVMLPYATIELPPRVG